MRNLDSISLDTSTLRLESESRTQRCWVNAAGEPLVVNFFDRPPDIPAPLNRLDLLRARFRRMAVDAGLGLVDLEIVEVAQVPSLRGVFKAVLDPATGHGRTYLGSLIVPFRDFSYTVKMQYREWGITGFREAAVLTERGDREDWLEGWIVDPADPAPKHLARNLSEDRKYDSRLPQHPLTRVRQSLDAQQASLRIADDVRASPFFGAPRRSRPWWLLW